MHALAQRPEQRYASARDFARALEAVIPAASAERVRELVELNAGAGLAERADKVREVEAVTTASMPPPPREGDLAAPALPPTRAAPDRDALTMTSLGPGPNAPPPEPPPFLTGGVQMLPAAPKQERPRAPVWLGALAALVATGAAVWLALFATTRQPRAGGVIADVPSAQAAASEPTRSATSASEPLITMGSSPEPSPASSSATAAASVAVGSSGFHKAALPSQAASANAPAAGTPTASSPATSSAPRCFKVKNPDGSTGLKCSPA